MHLQVAIPVLLAVHAQVGSMSETLAATLSTSPSSTISTLPPAQPSSGNPDPCNFADRTSLLDHVVSDWQGYNISLLVATCSDVCLFIYGDGNPDVSGVGAMISYYIQFISTILIGPLIHILALFDEYFGHSFHQFLDMMKEDLVFDINIGNSYIMLTLMIAAIVRINQSPPAFELDFILYLAIFQLFMAVGRSAVIYVLFRKEKKEERKGWKVAMHFSTFAILILTAVVSGGGYPSGIQGDALVAISKFCAYENDLPVPLHGKKENDRDVPWGLVILFVFGFIFLLIALIVVSESVWLLLCHIWTLMCEFILQKMSKRAQKMVIILFLTLCSTVVWGIWVASCVVWLLRMENAREDLEKALGKNYLDTQWGFGQVTAILMWIPTLLQILSKVLSFKPTQRRRSSVDATEYHQLQRLPSSSQDASTNEVADARTNLSDDMSETTEDINSPIIPEGMLLNRASP